VDLPRLPPEGLTPIAVSGPAATLGRYRIVSELARGGMSVVHLALMQGPARFHKLLVLKELKASLAQDPKLVAMFLAEARLAARLNHPHVVQTLEVGSDGARHYIVMEYLDGRPLSQMVARARSIGAPVPLHAHLAVLAAALDGLAYAHGATGYDGRPLGLVHRDVSPQNVFVTCDGQVKILDFGIAKAADMVGDTGIGVLKGKIAYMAPEQAAGRPLDARVDVFAAGVMLFEAATQRRFWANSGNDWQIVQALARGELPTRDPRTLLGVDSELRWIIQTCLAPDPADRYPSAGALLDDLRPLVRKLTPPSFGVRELGQRVRELFATDRARMQALIEAQVAQASEAMDAGEEFAALSGATPSSISPVSSSIAQFKTTLSSTFGRASTGTKRLALAGAGAALVASAVLAAAPRGAPAPRAVAVSVSTLAASPPPPVAAVAAPLAAAPAALPAALAVAPPVAGVIVEIRATPAWAHVRLDGRAVPNPYMGRISRDGARHTIVVDAPGFFSQTDTFAADVDTEHAIALRGRPKAAGIATVEGSPAAVAGPAEPSVPAAAAAAPAGGAVTVRPIDSTNPYAR
jgi:serine/threonine-protein kinase